MRHQTASHPRLKNEACNSYKQTAHSENIKVSIVVNQLLTCAGMKGAFVGRDVMNFDTQQTQVTINAAEEHGTRRGAQRQARRCCRLVKVCTLVKWNLARTEIVICDAGRTA